MAWRGTFTCSCAPSLVTDTVKNKTEDMKAIWNNQVIAESDDTIVIEGNHYFPESSIKKEFIEPSDHSSVCPWKGTASYYSLNVDGQKNKDAVWYYSNPSELAKGIKDRVAFWKGVEIAK